MSLKAEHLSVSLGETRVISDVSIAIESGGWLGLIGPNGAGKSTILRAIVGTIDHEGSIEICGSKTIHQHRRQSARMIAYVPQRPQLPSTMSVRDYVMLGRTPHLSLFANETRHDVRVVDAVLERLELSALHDRVLGDISGGEAQRAVLGRALVQESPILVMDEPTTGLDLGHQEQVLELTDDLRRERGLTIVCAMHDLTVSGQFCDYLTLIDSGKVVLSGPPANVLTPEYIGTHFGASVRVFHDDTAGLIVAPRRRGQRRANSDSR